jgi:hypothetical protein
VQTITVQPEEIVFRDRRINMPTPLFSPSTDSREARGHVENGVAFFGHKPARSNGSRRQLFSTENTTTVMMVDTYHGRHVILIYIGIRDPLQRSFLPDERNHDRSMVSVSPRGLLITNRTLSISIGKLCAHRSPLPLPSAIRRRRATIVE